jgi:hypothetical protein
MSQAFSHKHFSVEGRFRLWTPRLVCRDQTSVVKFRLAPIFLSEKIKFDLKQELKIPGLGWYV